ncbi:prolyl oligopeptidase family serine peptidase [Aestuariibaculum suncheonense]|uniref:Prolyl oligopeptidase family serine peptidase n=1 Tax=Aestuariibaculum suncheonense TaxID=1028745 RepID=A0A8J6QA56_9FLAO|nr:prolyl oligopeptidase family serine peptidase [Aestuariibaculum suncheonense]MBD0834168.1 prolyl oligopeptidase family serine peptidase [Aestuariibaculum suncheonense]
MKTINRISFLFVGLILGFTINSFAQHDEMLLWQTIPEAIENKNYKEEFRLDSNGTPNAIRQVSIPTLKPFLVESTTPKTPAVVVCPGGGYSVLSHIKEGDKIAEWLNSLGISAFVLKYRLPSDAIMKDKAIGPLQDAQEAIRTLRRNADKWHLDVNKIGIIGFSAGGHLASTASTHYNDKVYKADNISARPDFSMLIYPVISMEDGITHNGSKVSLLGKNASKELIKKYSNEKQVNENTPQTILIHSTDDHAVPVENSINYYLALKKLKVPAEIHIYKDGGHGFGLGRKGTHTQWSEACENWLRDNKIISEKPVYMFSYFKGNGEDGLHLAYSEDGYKWTSLKNDSSFLRPEVGKDKLMRDPCIIKGGNGLYHMVWTVSWTDKGIGYASSKDLINWSKQKFIPVMAHEEGARNTWAPEITYNNKTGEYMIYWATTIIGKFPETQTVEDAGYNHRMYYTKTKDFETFTPTKLFYEPGFNVIDATIKQYDTNKYVMFLKDETKKPVQKNLKVAFSDEIDGPYSEASAPITGKFWAEGPTAIKMNGKWIVYFDKYTDHKYGAVQSTDLKHWEDISNKIEFPSGTRHGTIFTISQEEFQKLKNQ